MGFLPTLAPNLTNSNGGLTIQNLPPPHSIPCTLDLKEGDLGAFLKEPFLPFQQSIMRLRHRDTRTARITEITQNSSGCQLLDWGGGASFTDSPRRPCVQTREWSSFTKFYSARLLLYLLGDLTGFALGEGPSK